MEQDEDQMYATAELEVPEPTLEDINAIVESLKNNKAPGEDNINEELLKLAGRDPLQNLHKTISIIWKEEKIEKDWNTVVICPIYKKGDSKRVENYRGISLRAALNFVKGPYAARRPRSGTTDLR